MDSTLSHEKPIKHMVEVELFYRECKNRTEIDVIGRQKQSMILGMLWLTCYNSEIDWKIGEVKITRYPDEYRKQQKTKQMKL